MADECIFCAIIADRAKLVTPLVREWPDAIALVPLNPVIDGHLIVVPKAHVEDAAIDPLITGMAAARAAELADTVFAFNLITSAGVEATQTIRHLHWHYVPRFADDGLTLPWTGQHSAAVDVGFAAGVAAGRAQAAADIRAVDVGRIADLEGDTARVGLTVAARIAEGSELQ